MAKKPPVRIALDLETTGLHPEQDVILEVAAIKFQGGEILEQFESFVTPRRPVPYRVQRLTGIVPELLTNAPTFESISSKLQRFLGDFPLVGHSIPFDASFLQRHGLARTNPLIDTFELASILLPSSSSYSLGQVATSLGLHVPEDRHRAMVDTVLAMRVFLLLHERIQAIDLPLLKEIANLDAPRSWSLLSFFRQELRARMDEEGMQRSADIQRGSLGNLFTSQLGMDPRILSYAIAQKRDEARVPAVTVDVAIPEHVGVQHIESQVEVIAEGTQETNTFAMSTGQASIAPASAAPQGYQTAREAVHQALEQQTPLLLEVTTGGSDYAPALLPALEWLGTPTQDAKRAKRLVIACANSQGARRLMETVLPRLQATLRSQFAVAYLAERGGYICLHRWFGAALRRTNGELTAEEARGLAKVGLWAQQTLTGEQSELNLLQQELPAWERICSGIERVPLADSQFGTIYQRCTYRNKGYCFVNLAEDRVQATDIVVTTHTGLFDDLSSDHSLLSDIPCRLILDADVLEEEHARWTNAELEQRHLLTLLHTIGMEVTNGRYQGLFALAAPSLRERGPGGLSTTPTIAKTELDTRLLSWFQSLRQAHTAVERLFGCYQRLLEEYAQQGINGNGREKGKGGKSYGGRGGERNDTSLRLDADVRTLSSWSDTEKAWQQLAHRLQTVIDIVREAEKILLATQSRSNKREIGSSEESIVASELAAVAQQLLEKKQLGQRATTLTGNDTVYWLRVPFSHTSTPAFSAQASSEGTAPVIPPTLYSQVIQTASLLNHFLHPEKTGTIYVGTSLSVDNSFSFYRGRFGLENVTCPALSVVTEHHEQTLLWIPNDVPEPNTPQYQRQLDETLIRLASSLDGQVIALFTSHSSLRSSYAALKPVLEARGILVLGQGIDGSPRQLLSTFQSQERVVLLGAGSFWDGIEDMPFSPTCLFITRLPMPVLNDPPTAARAELYSDQLHQLTVPLAALRLRRALNRLVWNDDKRNSIVLFDRRVVSKEYGSIILHTLPRCSVREDAVSHLPDTLNAWLTGTGAWE
jgi:DNA polymerase III epsilon subunit family exonuclease